MTAPELKRSLFSTPLVRLEQVRCIRAARGLSCEECKSSHVISVPLSGVNVRHVDGRAYTISPENITLSNRGEVYRVSHPYGSGEVQLNMHLEESLLLDIVSESDPSIRDRMDRPFLLRQCSAAPRTHLAARMLAKRAAAVGVAPMEVEQATIEFLSYILQSNESTLAAKEPGARELELTQQAKAYLSANYMQPLTLEGIARHANVSVFRLCHAFRCGARSTLWSHLLDLRIIAALERIADDERDFTRLALDIGFSTHSHFSSAFRRATGRTPSQARELLRAGRASRIRDLLQLH